MWRMLSTTARLSNSTAVPGYEEGTSWVVAQGKPFETKSAGGIMRTLSLVVSSLAVEGAGEVSCVPESKYGRSSTPTISKDVVIIEGDIKGSIGLRNGSMPEGGR
mmetsp:Transcript_11480/g.24861  ORF Transcript_11480/g.24861 Transcript_11480/m.24861 type:complete len:105 (-) Transcript_11480:497-811(-)